MAVSDSILSFFQPFINISSIDDLLRSSGIIFGAGIVLVISQFLKFFYSSRKLSELPISYKVCIVGLPKSGKTTLITAVFELILRGDVKLSARLLGSQTITRVNQYIERLNSGERIGPTLEGDTFIFRFSYTKSKLFNLIKRIYDVEIADFPGEYTESLEVISNTKNSPRKTDTSYVLFDMEFFSWVATAQEYLFVIDLADIYSSLNPRSKVASISSRVRASWQIIEDAVSERGIGLLASRPVHIVFTKLDCFEHVDKKDISLFMLRKDNQEINSISTTFEEIGNTDKLNVPIKIDSTKMEEIKRINDALFDDLKRFFVNKQVVTDATYLSMIWYESRNRFGVKDLLIKILP